MMLFILLCVIKDVKSEIWYEEKIDRKTKVCLLSLFKKKPENIEVFILEDSIYVIKGKFPHYAEIVYLPKEQFRKLIAKPVEFSVIENARGSYILGQTIIGLSIYSWALPVFLLGDDGDATIFVALGLFTPLIWFIGTTSATSGVNISYGSAYGSFLGGIEGVFHGGGIFNSSRAIFPVSVTENFFDFYLGQRYGVGMGAYQRKFNHFLLGYYHYSMLKLLFEKDVNWESEDSKYASVLSLIESYISLFISKDVDYLSYGDALFELRTTIIGGEFIPSILLTLDMCNEDLEIDTNWCALGSLLGHGIGYYIGYTLSKKYDISPATAFLSYLVPYLAHGFSGGVGVVLESEEYWNFYPLIFISTEIVLTHFIYKNLGIEEKKARDEQGLMIHPLFYTSVSGDKKFLLHKITPGIGISFSF